MTNDVSDVVELTPDSCLLTPFLLSFIALSEHFLEYVIDLADLTGGEVLDAFFKGVFA